MITSISFAQNTTGQIFQKNNITKPDILSTHSFGVHFSRIQGNFKSEAPKNRKISFTLKSGNVWNPQVKTYIPKDENDRQVIRDFNWDQAHRAFDESTIDKDSFNIKNDGVIKGLNLKVCLGLTEKHEIQIGLRTFILTKGKF